MASAAPAAWKNELQLLVRRCKARIIGAQQIVHAQHGLLVATAIEAFGDDPRATFYVECQPPQGNIPRPDLILLHPEVGVLVIENKGIRLEDIHDVHGTALRITRDGKLKEEDPFLQAERVMFSLKDLCRQRFDVGDALFLRTAAFPRLRRSEFEKRFKLQLPPETLFSDACLDAKAFRKQVLAYAQAGQNTARKKHRLTRCARDAMLTILLGRGLFSPPRRTFIDEADVSLLGMQIQQMELALKDPTQQQRELGNADLLGSHRLFRGVAGSGKSIMLALSVAQTLMNYSQSQGLFDSQSSPCRVLVVCYNRTLVHYLRSKIQERYGRIAWDAPSEDILTVTHFEGLVRIIQSQNPAMASKLTWEHKDQRAKEMSTAFDQLDAKAQEALVFDAIYVDEGQDLLPSEFELLKRLARKVKDGSQTLIIFYDNAQNIFGVTPPTWSELGINIVGRTVFLDTCLRNTAETLAFAFNVLVGSFASQGQRVATRQFADTASLKQRGLISEDGDRYNIHFSPRSGPIPTVHSYPSRRAEIDGVVAGIQTLIRQQKVHPNDILVLYKSHHAFGDRLVEKLRSVVGPEFSIRQVDAEHNENKSYPLMEEGVLTISTVASAKGYDAPVVFLIGADELATDLQGRASFYVGATRAKLSLFVSGTHQRTPGLLDELVLASQSLSVRSSAVTPPAAAAKPISFSSVVSSASNPAKAGKACRHCGGNRLHAQHGRFGYFYRCIDCTENTPIDMTCPNCGKKGRIRKQGLEFFRECQPCQYAERIHTNVPLETL